MIRLLILCVLLLLPVTADAGMTLLYSLPIPKGNDAGFDETNLGSYQVPGGTLDIAGKKLLVVATGRTPGNGTKKGSMYWGQTNEWVGPWTSGHQGWRMWMEIRRLADGCQDVWVVSEMADYDVGVWRYKDTICLDLAVNQFVWVGGENDANYPPTDGSANNIILDTLDVYLVD